MSGPLFALLALLASEPGGGGGSVLDTQTVTGAAQNTGANPIVNRFGYSTALGFGSISDGTSNLYSGAAITELYFEEQGYVSPPSGFVVRFLILKMAGIRANSGWTSMKVGSTFFDRADATYTTSGGNTTWSWNIAIPDSNTSAAPGPFNGAGTTTVEFT